MIYYKAGYKYQLSKEHREYVAIYPRGDIITKYIELHPTGLLIIRDGYAWDGPSGPTIDFKNFMRASLVHDALYQLIRDCYLSPGFRKQADFELEKICIKSGMWKIKARIVYHAVRFGGMFTSRPQDRRPILTAP